MNPSERSQRRVVSRRTAVLGILSTPALVRGAVAQGAPYPDKPIRMLIGTAPGASVDLSARTLATQMERLLKVSVVAENRPGANSSIAAAYVAQSAPDGYTLQFTAQSIAVNPSLIKVGYDISTIAAIASVASIPQTLVVPADSPVKDVAGLIAAATKNPNKLNYGSAGIGSPPHLATQIFERMAKVHFVHIPYKGTAPAMTDLLAGRLDFMIASLPLTKPYVEAGRLRALGISSAQRSPLAPNIPTISEMGVTGYESSYWVGLVAPPNTPSDIVTLLDGTVAQASKSPELEKVFHTAGMEVYYKPHDEFATMLRDETKRFAALLSGFKKQDK
ncbi:MAG: tripartite tricarboxylate transporter substrate binding protein [Rhizobiales bacterium]|nr:tripartite tricarboxylate transporter substrate binding protein [Hyphomicrobiales bacterium]